MDAGIATLEHPSWCSPKHCTAERGKVHRSRPARVRSACTDLMVITQLFQDRDSDTPLIDVTIRFPDYGPDHPREDYSFCFDDELAQAAGRMLVTTGRQATR